MKVKDNQLFLMTDHQLSDHLHQLARQITFHNAAEGDAYYRELPQLTQAQADFREAMGVAYQRGVDFVPPPEGYLL